jgi:hypothetical protein
MNSIVRWLKPRASALAHRRIVTPRRADIDPARSADLEGVTREPIDAVARDQRSKWAARETIAPSLSLRGRIVVLF